MKTTNFSAALVWSLLLAVSFAHPSYSDPKDEAEYTCKGEFEKTRQNYYSIGGCNLSISDARKVSGVCSLGQQCEVTGIIEHCKGVRGACIEITRISDIRYGKALPRCDEN